MGVEAVLGRKVRPLLLQTQVLVKFGKPARCSAAGRSHLCNQKSAFGQGKEVIGDAGLRSPRRKQKLRVIRLRDVEEENPVLPFQQAEQTTTSEDVLVGRKMAVMR